ncbi:hypothetical protein PR048_025496 [Dryococelus australis]|uniref:MADF domain-containing protein n=1 Tax=Dryococelus australis TaxID=614101 RepID=A0ABQ9GRF0_9NEOP|nr:hypothetical protein PR048_025496 [Dryococelus australis]
MEKTTGLIEMYRGSPCLWDPQHPEYKMNAVGNDAWRTMQKSGAGAEESYNSKWFVCKSLLFLMDKYKRRGTDDTMNTSESTSTANLDDTLGHSSAPNSQNVSTVSTDSTTGTPRSVQAPKKESGGEPKNSSSNASHVITFKKKGARRK